MHCAGGGLNMPMDTMVAATPHNPLSLRKHERGACPACASAALSRIAIVPDVPTNSCLMLDHEAEAVAFPRGDIDLACCEACGFIFNRAFDPALCEYSDRYEPTQAYSPTFNRFHQDLAARLAARVPLAGRQVVEVGCGQGQFLHLLCGLTGAAGIGFDPCLDHRRGDVVRDRAGTVRLVGEFFSEASVGGLTADLLVCKMTLEHIPAAGRFAALAAAVARASAARCPNGMQLFIQVPDSLRILRDCAFEDIYYEHCNYFTEPSLRAPFGRHGFRTEEVFLECDGQYLAILARYDGDIAEAPDPEALAPLRSLADGFRTALALKVKSWRGIVAEQRARGRSIVLWGSGSKGVSFISALGQDAATARVVDINRHRQGRYMVGSGHPIVRPEALRAAPPDTVIVMNAVYVPEITEQLAKLGLHPEVLAL